MIGKRKSPSSSTKKITFHVEKLVNTKKTKTPAEKLLEEGLEPYIDKELHTLIGDASDVNPFAKKNKIWETVLTKEGEIVRHNDWPVISPLFCYRCVVEKDSPRIEDYCHPSNEENDYNTSRNRYVCVGEMDYEPIEADENVLEYIEKTLDLSNDTKEIIGHTVEHAGIISRELLQDIFVKESFLDDEESKTLAKCIEVKRYLLHESYSFLERIYGKDVVRKKVLKKNWNLVIDVVNSIRFTPYVWCFRDHNCEQFEIITRQNEKDDPPTHLMNTRYIKRLKMQFGFLRELVPRDLERMGVWNQIPKSQQIAFTIYNQLLKPAYFNEMKKRRWSEAYKRMALKGEGHTFLKRSQIMSGLHVSHYAQKSTQTTAKNAIKWLKDIGAIVIIPDDIRSLSDNGIMKPLLPRDDDRIFLSYVHRWQVQLVASLVKIHMNSEEETLPITGNSQPRMKTLSEAQKNALKHCLNNPVTLITGPGGVGKTAIMKELPNFIKKKNILFCAPTGTASCVLSDSVEDDAYTIHSILYRLNQALKGKIPQRKNGLQNNHNRNVQSNNMITTPNNPFAGVMYGSINNNPGGRGESATKNAKLTESEQFFVDCQKEREDANSMSIFERLKDVRVVVIDEGSMVALRLIHMLLNRLLTGGSRVMRLVILGDVNQMHSIQGDHIFDQLIKGYELDPREEDSVHRLRYCFRTSSKTIFSNAMKICGVEKGDLVTDSSFCIKTCSGDDCRGKEETIRNHMKEVLNSNYYNPTDTEILVARRASAELINAICFKAHCNELGFESDIEPDEMSLPWKGTKTIKRRPENGEFRGVPRWWIGTRIFSKKNVPAYHWMNARPFQIKHYIDRNISTKHFVPPPWDEEKPIEHQKDRHGIVMRSTEIVRFICCLSLDGSNEKVVMPITKDTPLNNATVMPGYCGTIHYVQGSEHRCVVIFAFAAEFEFHWKYLYTAVTRAIEKVIIYTDSDDAIEKIRKREPTERQTILRLFTSEGLDLFRAILNRDKKRTCTSIQRITAGRKDVLPGYMKTLLQRISEK